MTPRAQQALPGVEVPSLPGPVGRLVRAFVAEEVQTSELVSLIEGDPGIATRLLRLANSAYYGFPREVTTIERALWLLGRTTVAALALGAAVFRHRPGAAIPPEAARLWIDAYRSAQGCRYLARRLPPSRWRSSPDALFLTGLLHDVGMILFLAEDSELYGDLLRSAPTTSALLSEERRVLGQDHAALSGDALEAWNFPPPMVAVSRYHHDHGLRAELLPDWEAVAAVDAVLSGESQGTPYSTVTDALLDDLREYLEGIRPEAEAFFLALA